MKRALSLLLCAALALGSLIGCGPKGNASTPSSSGGSSSATSSSTSTQPPDSRTPVNFSVLVGPTGVGAAKLFFDNEQMTTLNQYNVSVAAENNQITDALINGTTDIAALATNVAANLYAKSNGGIQILCVNTMGVLYLLEKGDSLHTISDLKGKTIYATGQGANPEYILNYLLAENGLTPQQVDIQWLTAQEVSAKMATADSGICMLPVPAATALLAKDPAVRQALSLSEQWSTLNDSGLAMGCIVARTDFIEENPQAIEDFLTEYEASITYISSQNDALSATDPMSPAAMVAQFELTPSAAIAAAAIPQCNLTFLPGDEMKDTLEAYYRVLFQANPAAIGGSMPYDSFYYGVG